MQSIIYTVTSSLIKSFTLKKKIIRNLHVYTMLLYFCFPISFTVIPPISRIGEGLALEIQQYSSNEWWMDGWVAGWLGGWVDG